MTMPIKLNKLVAIFIIFGSLNSSAELKDEAGPSPKPGVEKFSFDYEFGRPIRPEEMTYNKYRKLHMEQASKKLKLPMEAIGDGMDTWHWWVGVDNPGFWSDLTQLTSGPHNYTHLRLDLLRLLMITPRAERFKKLGIINDPDAVAADHPDQFGLTLDRMKDGTLQWDPEKFGYSSGVIGLQLFKNEKFNPQEWSTEEYIRGGRHLEPPYKIGMACVFCHVSFNPLNPPLDPAEPKWENLTSTFGNQYLREGLAFASGQKESSIVLQYLQSQEPGTSETSRFPSDSINNPTNINAILRLLERLKETHVENITPAQATMIKSMYKNAGLKLDNFTGALGGTDEHPTLKVPHILTDGSDSLGVLTASVRVYVNEGLMHKDWYSSWPINIFDLKSSWKADFQPKEFDILGKERQDPDGPWMQTERRMPNMATFLMSYDSFPLRDAKDVQSPGSDSLKNGKAYLTEDEITLNEGKTVFAENCASCHSSKRPNPMPQNLEDQKKAWKEIVFQKDFLENNYLSDDDRHSVLEIGTNVQRAMGTNAMAGSTWGQMSSQTYKDQREPIITVVDHDLNGNERPLYNPLTGKYDIKFRDHAAFYRTPTLVSIWASAPYFHNNSLGKYTGDPSLHGRMEAYEDAMKKLLWPETRDGIKSIKQTTTITSLPDVFPGLGSHFEKFDEMKLRIMELPAGTPVNLLLGFSPVQAPRLILAYLDGFFTGTPQREHSGWFNQRREAGIEALEAKLLELNTCPDFIEDRGHTFGSQLTDHEKKSLIEYIKHF